MGGSRNVRGAGVGRGRRVAGKLALCVVVLLAAVVIAFPGRARGAWHAIDQRLFHEAAKDAIGRFVAHEDWSRVATLGPAQDYGWLLRRQGPLHIAHGLGEISGEANSLAALRRSAAAGFQFFEVDLWLDKDVVHCFHGPGVPPTIDAGGCTLDSLMAALPRDAWLILDIKTDFQSTGDRIVQSLRASGTASRVIFQLYKPEQFAVFRRWQETLPLPGPIVTAYLARRSANTVAAAAAQAGARAFTLPLDRLDGFSRRPPGLAVLAHPFYDCAALRQAAADGVRGFYMENNLGCAGTPSISRANATPAPHED